MRILCRYTAVVRYVLETDVENATIDDDSNRSSLNFKLNVLLPIKNHETHLHLNVSQSVVD